LVFCCFVNFSDESFSSNAPLIIIEFFEEFVENVPNRIFRRNVFEVLLD